MKGHIAVRHGKHRESWFYKLYLGRDPMTGKKNMLPSWAMPLRTRLRMLWNCV